MSRLRAAACAAAVLLGACRWTPLGGKVAVGEEPYLIFAADGVEGAGDLFLAGTGGGTVYPLTFTRVDERLPAPDSTGVTVAFARARRVGGTAYRITLMNLFSGSERMLLEVPAAPRRLAWAPDGTLLVEVGDTVTRLNPPPGDPDPRPVTAAERPAADSALATVLGSPPFATVVPCGAGLCLRLRDGTEHPLDPAVREASRWGDDSVAYVVDGRIEVRALGPGALREVRLTDGPEHPRGVRVFLP